MWVLGGCIGKRVDQDLWAGERSAKGPQLSREFCLYLWSNVIPSLFQMGKQYFAGCDRGVNVFRARRPILNLESQRIYAVQAFTNDGVVWLGLNRAYILT